MDQDRGPWTAAEALPRQTFENRIEFVRVVQTYPKIEKSFWTKKRVLPFPFSR